MNFESSHGLWNPRTFGVLEAGISFLSSPGGWGFKPDKRVFDLVRDNP